MAQVTFKDVQKLAEGAIVFQKYISAVCKTTNATTALSQLFVADYYNGNCINIKGYDVLTHDGKKIQVKGKWCRNDKPTGPSGGWLMGEENEADLWVFVGFNSNYELIYALEMTPDQVISERTCLDKRTPNKATLNISKKLIKKYKNLIK
jgi:hypothetical protein